MRVLVIGDKLRFLAELLTKLSTLEGEEEPVVKLLIESRYDMRFVSFYLSFDVIVCPYRLCLMHLALARQTSSSKPYIILQTGASENLNTLVGGHICEELGMFVNPRMLGVKREDYLSVDYQIPKETFVEFMAYIGRNTHGSYPDWARLPITEAYEGALNYYERKRNKDMERRNFMLIKPMFPVEQTSHSPELKTCFIIMPFESSLTKIYVDIIKPTIEKNGLEIKRADDFFTVGSVMADIWKRINQADFLIADLTGRNPNVYYELGIAHTLGKLIIMITQDIDDVPFDIRDKRIIKYSPRYDDVAVFERALAQSIEEIRKEHAKLSGIEE